MRTVFVLAILLLTFNTTTYGKGCEGTYFISGTAYSSGNTVLKNKTLTVTVGTETKIVVTDDNGHFEIEITWINACPSKLTKEQLVQLNRKLNPQLITISYADKTITLENNGEKYAKCEPKSKATITWKKDLYFS